MGKLRKIDGGPSRDTERAIGEIKARLRRNDVRALAVVLVYSNGTVSTMWAGSADGHHHRLGSGIGTLASRFFRGE